MSQPQSIAPPMKPLFHPALINGPFGDPGLYVDCLFEKRALLFIEAPFLAGDAERAAQKYHLTAYQAGSLARGAGVKTVVPLHLSPRYHDRETELRDEIAAAFSATNPLAR